MTLLYEWSMADKAIPPTVGSNTSVTTNNANNADTDNTDMQLSTDIFEEVVIPYALAPLDKCNIKGEFVLDFAPTGTTYKGILGNYVGLGSIGQLMLSSYSTTSMSVYYNGVVLDMRFAYPAVAAAHQSGKHTFELIINNLVPVSGSDHIVLILDGVLLLPTSGGVTSPWTALNPTKDIGVCGLNSFSYPATNVYASNVTITDEGVLPPLPVSGITVDETEQKLYPRNSAKQSDIVFTGGYTGGDPSGVTVQLKRVDNDAIIQVNGNDSNPLTSTTIGSLAWEGTLANVPSIKAWYYAVVWPTEDPVITAQTTLDFTVGFIAMWTGQSGAKNFFDTGTGTPNTFTLKYPYAGTTGRAWGDMEGDGATLVADALVISLDCIVGLMDYGIDSAAIEERNKIFSWWLTDITQSTNYSFMKLSINALGGKINHVFLYIGETEALVDPSTIITSYPALIDQFRADIGYAGTGVLPFTGSMLARWNDANLTDTNWALSNAAILNAFDTGKLDKLTTPIDLTLVDFYHIDTTEYAPRIVRAIEVQEGVETTYRSPRMLFSSIVSDTEIDVTFDIDDGTTISATSNSIDVNIGTIGAPSWVNSTGVRQSPTVMRFTHTVGAAVEVRGLYGRMADITDTLTVDGTLALPMIQEEGIKIFTTITPNLGLIEIVGFNPVIFTATVISPNLGSIEITGYNPTIIASVGISPNLGLIEITGFNPTIDIKEPLLLTPNTGIINIVGFNPVIGSRTSIAPNIGSIIITGFNPSIKTNTLVRPPSNRIYIVPFTNTL